MAARRAALVLALIAGGCAQVAADADAGRSAPDAAPAADAHAPPPDAAPDASARDGAPGVSCPAAAACGARECGADPVCATPCGSCPDRYRCDDGACHCVPACDGKACGSDGCGGRCGECGGGEYCDGAACRPIPAGCPGAADCGGRECGPDPVCGVDCGACADGHRCEDGRCRCVPDCRGRTCGDDGCGGSCGACADGQACADGRCRCVPDCRGRTCGDDGCGGSCGACAPGFACGAGGQCQCPGTACGAQACCADGESCNGQRCCPTFWSRALDDRALAGVLPGPDGHAYAVGQAAGRARVMAVDACGDTVADTPLVVGAETGSSASMVTWADGDLLVGGQVQGLPGDPADGFFARLSVPDLRARWAWPLVGGFGADEVDALAVAPGGAVWMTGAADAGDGTTGWWGITGDVSGQACGWNAAPGHAGVGRGVAVDARLLRVYMTGSFDGQLVLEAFDAACAHVTEPCGCDPVFQVGAPSLPGTTYAEGRRVVLHGDVAYVVGFATPEDRGNLYGVLVRVDLNTGAVTGPVAWDPSPLQDGFIAAAPAPDGLFVGGIRGWAAGDPVDRGTAVLLHVSSDLEVLGEQDLGPGAVTDLASGPDALYVARSTGDRAGLARCRPTGECP